MSDEQSTQQNVEENLNQTTEGSETETETEAELEQETESDDSATVDENGGKAASAEDGEGEEEQTDPRDEQIAKLQQQVREMDGRVGAERGHKLTLQKLIKELEKNEGAVNRDALAETLGFERSRLDGILDQPMVDDNNALRKRAGAADKQLKSVAKVLKANGKDAEEISTAYTALLNFDDEERQRFMDTPEEELGAYIIERVAATESKLKPLVAAKGNVFEALDALQKRNSELEAENAQLKKTPSRKQRVPLESSGPGILPNGNNSILNDVFGGR